MTPDAERHSRRRFDKARMKRKARKVYPHDQTAKAADHLATCSCHMCGNPRKHWNEETIQEKREEITEQEFRQGLQ